MKSIDKLRDFWRTHAIVDNCGIYVGVNKPDELYDIAHEIEAEIADNYMRLPVDADGVPIHVGDAITLPNGSRDDVRFITIRKYDTVFNERGWVPSQCTHAKPRTLEDVLRDVWKEALDYAKSDMWRNPDEVFAERADEIREPLDRLPGGGECEPTEEYTCNVCGQDLVACDIDVGPNGGAIELDPPILYNYCPNCGKAVKR